MAFDSVALSGPARRVHEAHGLAFEDHAHAEVYAAVLTGTAVGVDRERIEAATLDLTRDGLGALTHISVIAWCDRAVVRATRAVDRRGPAAARLFGWRQVGKVLVEPTPVSLSPSSAQAVSVDLGDQTLVARAATTRGLDWIVERARRAVIEGA